jgi:hypothetical protein
MDARVALLLLSFAGCTDKDVKHTDPCDGIVHAQLTMGLLEDPGAAFVPFNEAEFIADRTIRFTNHCSIVSGGSTTTKCTLDTSGQYRITYPDAVPFNNLTLRVFDRFGALQLEKSRSVGGGMNIFDDCPEFAGYLTVRYVLDPPGVQPDAGEEGGADAASD